MRRYIFRLLLLLTDILAYFVSFFIVFSCFSQTALKFDYTSNLLLLNLIILMVFLVIEETYSLREENIYNKIYYLLKADAFSFIISLLFLFNVNNKFFPILFIMIWYFLLFFLIIIFRQITEKIVVKYNIYFRKTLLVVSEKNEKSIFRKIFGKGYSKINRVKKILYIDELKRLSEKDIDKLLKENQISQVVIFSKKIDTKELIEVQRKFEGKIYLIKIIPELTYLKLAEMEVIEINNFLVLENRQKLLSPYRRLLKRIFDIFGSTIAMIIFSPVFLVIIIAVKLTSKGPVFYPHKRLGYKKERFPCWKFRTMVMNADEILEEWLEKNPEIRDEFYKDFKLKNDPRITKIGNFLRKTSLDEFPQLWNVLKGDMSLVGPRPIVEKEVFKYKEWSDMLFRVKPGITGMWQASGRNDIEYDDRVELDMYYIKNWSLWLDIIIIVKTIFAVFKKEGAY